MRTLCGLESCSAPEELGSLTPFQTPFAKVRERGRLWFGQHNTGGVETESSYRPRKTKSLI